METLAGLMAAYEKAIEAEDAGAIRDLGPRISELMRGADCFNKEYASVLGMFARGLAVLKKVEKGD